MPRVGGELLLSMFPVMSKSFSGSHTGKFDAYCLSENVKLHSVEDPLKPPSDNTFRSVYALFPVSRSDVLSLPALARSTVQSERTERGPKKTLPAFACDLRDKKRSSTKRQLACHGRRSFAWTPCRYRSRKNRSTLHHQLFGEGELQGTVQAGYS
ncbi:hypothetical protein ZHAS_00014794 [Anopheles sinensis]|uniref:Uncharacterized protein n=1 Tax=Anopheles sinensis TaxID=74873 RepID=A0A084W953_ANOSI|nr:hypothetical protein ZHAS_00014794 [Anopheles sinensis]